jgi:hypothetical protein
LANCGYTRRAVVNGVVLGSGRLRFLVYVRFVLRVPMYEARRPQFRICRSIVTLH